MSKELHDTVRVNPLCRFIWNTLDAKEYWEEKITRVQQILKIVYLEAYKTGVFKTYSHWSSRQSDNSIFLSDIGRYGKFIAEIPSGTSPARKVKAYSWYCNDEGLFRLFANQEDFPLLPEDIMLKHDLFLTAGYAEADIDNVFWYLNNANNGILDPIAEMEDQDEFNWLLNPFLRHLGISLLPYVPKSWKDEYSLELAGKIFNMVKEIDEEIAKDLQTLLELPTKWDCWRGVAIIDTPIFKSVTDSVPYKVKQEVKYEVKMTHLLRLFIPGATYGIVFPYITKKEERKLKANKENLL